MTLAQSSFRKPRQIIRAIGVIPNPASCCIFCEQAECTCIKGGGAHQVQMAPITVVVPSPQRDPYADNRAREAAIGGPDVMAKLTYDHPSNVRARRVAALREELSKPVERRYPHEGRSDRVYLENRR